MSNQIFDADGHIIPITSNTHNNKFSPWDYVVFAGMLLVSSAIGIYFACGGKQSNTKEYLMAGRNMSWFPLFVSLLASYLSAVTLLGVPSEIYTYGIQYIVLCFSYFLLIGAAAIIFLPIFYKLQYVSSNEYLEKRFSKGVRFLGFGLVMTQYVFYLSVVLYAPSLALHAVANVPIPVTVISTGLVCTFYTTLGGMKAVIWTDVFQAGVMVTGLIVVIIVGVIDVGGFAEIFRIAADGGRMKVFDFNPDPTVRNTFWTLAIGGAFTAMPLWTVCQPAVQRFQAAKSLRESQKALLWNIPGLIVIVLLCVMDGLVIYAVYAHCDIGKFGWHSEVTSNDQVLPYFIIDKLGKYHGLPGLFTSCLFSGALSTASSGLNSIAALALEDVIKKVRPNLAESTYTIASKLIACVFGVLVVGLAFLVAKFGPMVLQLAYSIFGIIGGPYLGLFCLGMLVPFSNSKGAYVGAFFGVFTTLWLAIGSQVHPPRLNEAVVKADGCPCYRFYYHNYTDGHVSNTTCKMNYAFNATTGYRYKALEYEEPDTALASWYSMSYLWYAAIGVSYTFVAGLITSVIYDAIVDEKREEVPDELLFSYRKFFNWFLPKNSKFRYEAHIEKGLEMELQTQSSMTALTTADQLK